ncbi:MAG: fructosamine kinase family protein [Flexilinea sp.]|nr:fructosamine kinase family protein [Flexilinea sp.]
MITACSLEEAIEKLRGEGVRITGQHPVFGGDINRAYELTLSDGSVIFMKANTRQKLGIFEGEAESLGFIRQTGTLRSPEVFAIGTDGDTSFLLMEYIPSGRKRIFSMQELGLGLARMHQAETSGFVRGGKYGALHDHLLGSGIQDNTPMDSWPEFFGECRLRPQFKRADTYFDYWDRKQIESLLGKLDRYLPEPERPSLLHGDIWAGNYMLDEKGHPWLIDPACYVGHAETDLALTELFGGFDHMFYDAYWSAAGYDPGYRERRDIYNLYHLVKHLNLFGTGYLSSVLAILYKYA